MGPQGQASQLWLPLLGFMTVGRGREKKQGLADLTCASQAEARAREGYEDLAREHCCLNIKQGCFVSHVGDFLMLPRALRWVPSRLGVHCGSSQCPTQSQELILGIYLSTSQSRGQEDRRFIPATGRKMRCGGGAKDPGVWGSFPLFPIFKY